MRENSWISLKIFAVIIPFCLGMLSLILFFIRDLSGTTLPFFLLHNEVSSQVAVQG